jgi:two-component system response regulator RpfG
MSMPNDVLTFSCPEFLEMERAIIQDFVTCTRECCEETDECVTALNKGGGRDYIHRLFRTLHSLKGNCQMVGLSAFTELLHHVEEIIGRVRSGQDTYFPELGDFLLIATDEIEALMNELINSGQASEKRRKKLYDVCVSLESYTVDAQKVGQFSEANALLRGEIPEKSTAKKAPKIQLELPADVELMRGLALHIDNLNIYRKNRSDQVAQLTQTLNEAMGFPLDAQQLQAASWMHDVGMGFIPHSIFNKEGVLFKEELRKIQEHVVTGSQLLLRFGGWNEAARMVLDHHERFDGSGYPNGLSGEEIHLGGRILSIIDTFCSITNERSDRSYTKSLLSAISEINANSESQFDPKVVSVFNTVVRKLMIKQ